MRTVRGGLTTRGRCFLAASIATGLTAFLLGEKALLQIAIMLGVLPLLCVYYIGRTRSHLVSTRHMKPHITSAEVNVRIVLTITNPSRVPMGTILLEESLPSDLSPRPRIVLEGLSPQQTSSVGYVICPHKRGRYVIGPLNAKFVDPFGLCDIIRVFPAVEYLTVIPPVFPLSPIPLMDGRTTSIDAKYRVPNLSGDSDDIAIRQYRDGDDLRRVHWRSTARRGELMVRGEEQPQQNYATIILDTRSVGYTDTIFPPDFEWAVTAAASIAVHLLRSGYHLRLVSSDGVDISTKTHTGNENLFLSYLAEAKANSQNPISSLLKNVQEHAISGLIIGIFGLITPTEATLIRTLSGGRHNRVVFLMDKATWISPPSTSSEEIHTSYRDSSATLTRDGWTVMPVQLGARLPDLWSHIPRESHSHGER